MRAVRLALILLAVSSSPALGQSPTLNSPADKAVSLNTGSYGFSWSNVINATNYRIYVDNNSGFGSPEINTTTTQTSYTYSASTLPNNLYYWKVQALVGGVWQSFSAPREFVTDTPPPSPTATGPSDGAFYSAGASLPFSWNAPSGVPNVQRYNLRIVPGTNLNNSPSYDQEFNATSQSVATAGWTGGTYVWGVRAIKAAPTGYNQFTYEQAIGWGPYATRTFYLPPDPASPVDHGISLNAGTYSFSWSTVSGASSYGLQADNNSGFGSPEISVTTAGTSYTHGTSMPNNVYFWRVRAQVSGTWQAWSIAREFVTDTPPPAPSPTAPNNGATYATGSSIGHSWDAPAGVSNVERYNLRIVQGTNLNTTPLYNQEFSGSSQTVSASGWSDGVHTWGVRAIKTAPPGYNQLAYEQAIGWGLYATRTIQITVPPSLVAPADRSISTNSGTYSFSWSQASGATDYRLQVDNNSGFGSPEIAVTTTGTNYTHNTRIANNIYYWRVQAFVGGVWQAWSTPREFVTDEPPPAPTPTAPTSGASYASGASVSFTWDPPAGVTNVERYALRIVAGTDLNATPIYQQEFNATNQGVSTSGWASGTYTWGVRAIKTAPASYTQLTYEQAIGWGGYGIRTIQLTGPPPDLTVSTNYVPGTTYIASEPQSIQVTVTRTGGTLSGSYVQVRIFLSADNQYQPGTDSQLWQSNDATPDFSVADLNLTNGSRTGTATILIPNQTGNFFLLTVVDRPDNYGADGFHAESDPNNNVEVKTFAVDRGLWGRVALASGTPVTNATIRLQPVGGSPVRQSVTDSSGTYRLPSAGLATQDYEILPSYSGYSFTPSFHRINGVSASGVYPNFDFSAAGPNTTTPRTISGTVYALGGAPLSGATVKAFLAGSTPDSQTTTLANGAYTLATNVYANSYAVHVESGGRFFLARQANATQGNVTGLDSYEQSAGPPVVNFDAATAQLFQQEIHPANQSRTISVEVFTQGSGTPTVTLEQRAINTSTWTSVGMTNTGVVWSCALPAGLFTTPGVEVRVVAVHNSLTTTTDPHQLRVGNRPPSQVTIVGVSATDPPILKATGQAHTFEAFVAEPDGDAVTVAVFYRMGPSWSSAAMTATGVPGRYSGTIPGSAIQSGVPTYYFVKAVDVFGASAETPRLQINRMPPRQGEPGQAQTVADPINAASGNYLFKKRVLPLQAHSRPFSLTLYYNALSPAAESLGHGWTHDFDTVLQPLDDGSVFVRYAHGGADTYVVGSTPNTWTCQNRAIRDTITKDASNVYTMTEVTEPRRRTIFTSFGRVSRIEWPDGVALACTWDATNRRLLSVQIQPAGIQFTLSYNAAGLVSAIADSTGRQVGLGHDTAGNLVELTDVGTERTRFEYDANHRVSVITLPLGNTLLRNVFDSQGRVTEQRDGRNSPWLLAYDSPSAGTTTVTGPDNRARRVQHGGREEWLDLVREDGRQVQVQYGANGLPSTLTTPDQQTFAMLYDGQGNVQSLTAPGNHTETMTWDASNLLASVTEPGNFTTGFSRDSSGRVTQLADQQGTVNLTFNGPNLTNVNDRLNGNTPVSYDAMGNVVGFTDPSGVPVTLTRDARGNVIGYSTPTQTRTIQVDAHGRPVRIVDSIAGEFVFGYDLNGNLTIFTTPLGTTRYVYDANDQLVEVINPDNGKTVYTRDLRGEIVRVKNALSHEWVLTRDELGRVTKITSPEGREVSYTYDWAGRALTRSDGAGTTTFIRDGRGLVTEVVDPMTNHWRFTRDGRGLVTKITDPLNRETSFEYDSARRLIAVVDPSTRRTSYSHDAHRLRVAGRPSGNGNVHYGYDAAGRALSMTDGMGRNWANTLTNGRLTSVLRPDGSLVSLTYDASGRLQSMSANGDPRSFTYDPAGLIATGTTPGGTTRVVRNHRGQIVRREDEFGYVVEAGYDAEGKIVSLTYDGMTVTYTYARDGLLLRMADSFNRVVEYGHDTSGRLVRVTYPNGVVTTITRDAAGRMTGLQHEKSGVILAAWTITLDPLGNRSRVTCTAGAVMWNLPNSVRDFTVSPTGQVQTQGGTPAQYDAQGCMTSWPSSTGTRTLTYTGYGRLATMNGGGSSTSYRYDADGEVLALVLNGTERRFVQDLTGPMSRILAEKIATNATLARYVHGLGLAYRIEAGTNAVRFYHSDPNGNIVLLTDETGAPTDRYAYTPFGETVGVVGSNTNPFRFGGSLGVFDVGDDTLLMRRRVYSPELGRFVSPDPVEQPTSEPQGRNLYAYVFNNPWGFADPTGLTANRDTASPRSESNIPFLTGRTINSNQQNFDLPQTYLLARDPLTGGAVQLNPGLPNSYIGPAPPGTFASQAPGDGGPDFVWEPSVFSGPSLQPLPLVPIEAAELYGSNGQIQSQITAGEGPFRGSIYTNHDPAQGGPIGGITGGGVCWAPGGQLGLGGPIKISGGGQICVGIGDGLEIGGGFEGSLGPWTAGGQSTFFRWN